MSNLISNEFFNRPPEHVAADLIGCHLYKKKDGIEIGGIIVETEAYSQFNDPACHAYQGKRTKRNNAMFAAPGGIYVYLIYGLHFCFNIACDNEGIGSAVLIRAIEPLSGIPEMNKRRPKCKNHKLLASGPGNLCNALNIDKSFDNTSLGKDIIVRQKTMGKVLQQGYRIGVKEQDPKPWRFFCKESKSVSMRRTGHFSRSN